MNVYVWKYLNQVTCNYHSGGGLMIVANDLDDAKRLAAETPGGWLGRDETSDIVIDQDPDYVYPLANKEDKHVIVFPDAGCC